MRLFDVLGPVMTGPSSSHTAGAVRIGSTARRLLGEQPAEAEILLYGSFAATGRGHGTDRALVAGLLAMQPDDDRIPNSFAIAKEIGLHFHIGTINLRGAHPNTAVLRLTGASGRKLEVVGASIGGGRINICQIDGITTNFGGDHNTLIVHHLPERARRQHRNDAAVPLDGRRLRRHGAGMRRADPRRDCRAAAQPAGHR